MKKCFVVVVCMLVCVRWTFAQTGAIKTIAGGVYAVGFAGDGLYATDSSVKLAFPTGVCRDASGNIYFADQGNHRVRRIDAVTGILTTIAGTGTGVPSGDGGPAASAGLNFTGASSGSLAVRGSNLYICETVRLRKVDLLTGIISTVAGLGSDSYSGDGGPAISAGITMGASVYADIAGNVFLTQGSRIRKINAATGIIDVFAGSETPGYSGDGGPAASALLSGVRGGTGDAAGNIYFCEGGNKVIRRVSSAGVISTICGVPGIAGYTGDGGPATAATISNPQGLALDGAGNIYFSCDGVGSRVIRKINAATGIIQTVAGCSTGCAANDQYQTEYVAAGTTTIGPTWLCADSSGVVYYTNYSGWVNKYTPWITTCTGSPTGFTSLATIGVGGSVTLKVTGSLAIIGLTYQWQRSFDGVTGWTSIAGASSSPYSHTPTEAFYYRCMIKCALTGDSAYSSMVHVPYAYKIIKDSLRITPEAICNPVNIYSKVNGISSLLRLKTWFGDGTSSLNTLVASGTTAFLDVPHVYASAGIFTVRQVLYYGSVPQDSVQVMYEYNDCKVFPLKFYFDANGNCSKDAGETYNYTPVTVVVDSNGYPVDTLSVTGGLYYTAHGPAGAIYSFRIYSYYLVAGCVPSGIYSYTVAATPFYPYPVTYVGLQHNASTAFDLSVHGVVNAGTNNCVFYLAVNGLSCLPIDAHSTLDINTQYKFGGIKTKAKPTPTFFSDNVIQWTSPGLISGLPTTIIKGNAWKASSDIPIGAVISTSFSVEPVGSDADPTNNSLVFIDTVTAPLDPNFIKVMPAGCFDTDTTLEYVVHFENLGNDTAHSVHVLDTISYNLDWRSIDIVSTSDQMNIYPYEEAGYKIVKFDFPNIKLLDSSWHGLNDGMFIYRIKTKAGLAVGESIFNRVGIYFDHNEVVMTNTVHNQKGCPVPPPAGVTDRVRNAILLYPNPATDELTITTEQGAFTSFTITNTVGQQLLQQDVTGMQTKVSVKELPAGVYYVALRGEQGSEVRKFVKW